LRLVLVEDAEPEAQQVLAQLRQAGFQPSARQVRTREEFLRALAEFKPDIILSEYALDQFGALEALALLRQHTERLPLVVVTRSRSEALAIECMQAGAEDCMFKDQLSRLPVVLRKIQRAHATEREREAAQAALRRSEEQFRAITEHTPDLICLLDLEYRLAYANPAFRRMAGRTDHQLAGADFLQWLHPEDLKPFQRTVEEARFFREARWVETRLRTPTQHWRGYEAVVSLIFNDRGQPERLLVVARDCTERKRAETEIRKLAAFAKFNPNPVLEFAADGTLTYFNDAAMAMARSFNKTHPQALLPLGTANIVRTCLATGQARQNLDTTINGRTLSWSFFPVPSNRVVHCYARDITESLNLEAQLRQALKMESIGQLAAGVAHDFNNILTVIQGHAGLLLGDPQLPAAFTESIKQISTAAERAASLTRQLLMFSRKQIMQPRLLNLNEVVQNLAKMVRTLLGEHITFRKHTAEGLPPIHADPGMIEQVIINLAANARDAMPRGGELLLRTYAVEIDPDYARSVPEARPGYFVCLSISDTGHGMTPEVRSHIFEPFFTTKEIGKGTGLGLATVYGIVKQHQGWIEVDTEVGQGTTFRVFFPAVCKAPPKSAATSSQPAPGGHETILVVEDEPALRELVTEILEKKGYTVLQAATGLKALEVWAQHKDRIDLLFTDMMMPEGVSGLELSERLRAERPELKVIYSSGYSLEVVNPEFVIKDGITFLQKPYDPEMLARVVYDTLNNPPSPASAT
jgi:PAS domain S-box-containing protein